MNKEDYSRQKELIELRHKYKMIELEKETNNAQKAHDLQLEVIRIKSAEIRRSQQRREFEKYGGPK